MQSNIDERIKATTLPRKSRLTAQYIADHKETVAYSPASAVAKDIGVSDVTVHRVAKQLGYESYHAMQEDIRSSVFEQIKTEGLQEPAERYLRKFGDQTGSAGKILYEEQRLAISHIINAYAGLSPETVQEAANALKTAGIVYVVGFWSAAAMAEYFAVKMRFILDHIVTITSQSPDSLVQSLNITENDCVVIFSYGPDIHPLEMLAKNAKACGAEIIGIIDRVTSAIAPYTDHSLVAGTEGLGFTSQIGTLYLIEVLLTVLLQGSYDKKKASMNRLTSMLRELNYYRS